MPFISLIPFSNSLPLEDNLFLLIQMLIGQTKLKRSKSKDWLISLAIGARYAKGYSVAANSGLNTEQLIAKLLNGIAVMSSSMANTITHLALR
jgi:hypothetical protein